MSQRVLRDGARLLFALLVVGCGEAEQAVSEPAAAAAAAVAASSVAAPAPSTTHVLPSLSGGSLDIETSSEPAAHMEIAAAHAYFLAWPGSRIEPLLFLDRVELIVDAADDHGCEVRPASARGRAPSPTASRAVERIELRSHGTQPLSWDTDYALGDDLSLCIYRGAGGEGDCEAFVPARWDVVLSVSRARVRGFVHTKSDAGDLRGRFRADVCPL